MNQAEERKLDVLGGAEMRPLSLPSRRAHWRRRSRQRRWSSSAVASRSFLCDVEDEGVAIMSRSSPSSLLAPAFCSVGDLQYVPRQRVRSVADCLDHRTLHRRGRVYPHGFIHSPPALMHCAVVCSAYNVGGGESLPVVRHSRNDLPGEHSPSTSYCALSMCAEQFYASALAH